LTLIILEIILIPYAAGYRAPAPARHDERNGNDRPVSATWSTRSSATPRSTPPGTSRPAPPARADAHFAALPADVRTTPGDLGGIPVIFIDIADVEPRGSHFHIHGGFFALGSATGSVGLASSLARKTGMPRRCRSTTGSRPSTPTPAALQDVTAAYRALAGQAGSAGHRRVSGESGRRQPRHRAPYRRQGGGPDDACGALLLSPDDRPHRDRQQLRRKAHADPAISAQATRTRAADYLAGTDPADPWSAHLRRPLRTPAAADPGRIARGALDDATRLAVKAAADDVAVILDITPASRTSSRPSPPSSTRATPPSTGPPDSSGTTPLRRPPPDERHQSQGNLRTGAPGMGGVMAPSGSRRGRLTAPPTMSGWLLRCDDYRTAA